MYDPRELHQDGNEALLMRTRPPTEVTVMLHVNGRARRLQLM
jgi:hypothetical protein